jgi:hypothetical protein
MAASVSSSLPKDVLAHPPSCMHYWVERCCGCVVAFHGVATGWAHASAQRAVRARAMSPGGGAQRANTMITGIAGFALRVPSTIMRVSVSRQRRDSYLA